MARIGSVAAPLEGRDAIQNDMGEFLRVFPDLEATVRSTMDRDNRYAFEARMVGTHQGSLPTPAGDLAPTGRRIQLEGAVIGRLDGHGRILEENRYYDLAGLVAQVEVSEAR